MSLFFFSFEEVVVFDCLDYFESLNLGLSEWLKYLLILVMFYDGTDPLSLPKLN